MHLAGQRFGRDVIERRVGEARQIHPTQVVLEGHGERGVETIEAERGDDRRRGIDDQRRHDRGHWRDGLAELIGRAGGDRIGSLGEQVRGDRPVPIAAGLGRTDCDAVGEQCDMGEAGSIRGMLRLGRSKRGNDKRVNQHGAIEIRLSDVGDGVLVVLAAVTRGIEDSVDRDADCRATVAVLATVSLDPPTSDIWVWTVKLPLPPLTPEVAYVCDPITSKVPAGASATTVPVDGGVPSPQSIVAV